MKKTARFSLRSSRCNVVATYFVVLALSSTVTAQQAAAGPNLIVSLTDDYSAVELRHLTDGFPTLEGADTPTLIKMKNEGVSFLTAWAMPICGPTRGSLMTGLYGQVTGWLSNKKPNNEGLGELFGTFANLAQKKGYKTLIAGKWQMTGEVRSYGFDEACLWSVSDDPERPANIFHQKYDDGGGMINPKPGPLFGQRSRYWHPFMLTNGSMIDTGPLVFGPNVIFDCAMNFISRQKSLGNPFLVYLPMLLTHSDWDYFRPEAERKITNFIPVPTLNAAGRITGREPGPGSMKRNIEYQDYLMGKLLNHVRAVGERNNTVTFFIGDNGSLGYGKRLLASERATRVPFIVHGPGLIKARRRIKELISVNDVYATLAGLMRSDFEGETPRPQSVDMSKFLLGSESTGGRAWLYGYLVDSAKNINGRWIRNKRFVLDGQKDFWRCPSFDERSCVMMNAKPGSRAQLVKKRFEKIICLLEKDLPTNPKKLRQKGICEKTPLT